MGTGIVSVGLAADGAESLSLALLAVAGLVWLRLAAGLWTLLHEQRTPGALTAVAGTNVLAARVQLLGWNREADALLVFALCLWLLLVPIVLAHWRTPTVGVSFLLTVATESIAVVGAPLAHVYGARWLAYTSLGFLVLGLVFYVLVVVAFELRQLVVGRGDQWVSGGALAIATLACARLVLLRSLHGELETASLALWAAAFAWLPLLIVSDLAVPRLEYDVRRWSTVFPVGMYAACSFAVARAVGIGGIDDFARVWIWLAVAVWVVAFAAASRGVVRRA